MKNSILKSALAVVAIILTAIFISPLIAGLGGAIGAITYLPGVFGHSWRNKFLNAVGTKNHYGFIFRKFVTPTNPNSAKQLAQRAIIKANALAYKVLSRANVLLWETFAQGFTFTDKQGNNYTPTAIEMYQKCNTNLAIVGESAISAPSTDVPNHFMSFSVAPDISTPGSETMIASFTPVIAATEKVIIEATPVLGNGISYITGWRQIAVKDNTFLTGVGDLEADYEAVFGVPSTATGQRIAYRARRIRLTSGLDSGIASDIANIIE